MAFEGEKCSSDIKGFFRKISLTWGNEWKYLNYIGNFNWIIAELMFIQSQVWQKPEKKLGHFKRFGGRVSFLFKDTVFMKTACPGFSTA